ncbi:kinesin-like protein KIF17 [Montipora capricornis]|uniref:kinesin-like protein KIF17 n=1 Tax=Montipora capricornis TaxID=246305 RepID=UPI0035F1AFC9
MSESVKVIVRCRPLNEKEREMNTRFVIETNSSLHQCSIKKRADDEKSFKTFTFDGVYGIASSTEKIYSEIVRPIVNGIMEGYNGTVFAYGQTSCGKTFTMEGIQSPAAHRGIIPRCCEHIFNGTRRQSVGKQAKYILRVSYLEIYNEEIRDLLVKQSKCKPEIKEHPDKGIYVKGLSSITVDNYSDMQHILESGGRNRSVGATLLNVDSSRSHSIFTIDLEACFRASQAEKEVYRTGKLNLVDLAGSERQSKSGSSGERFKESTKINLSLSVLGNVISALVDRKSKHVPYRDSKLTRLLQDSLGGNSKTLMVACVSPGENNYEETLSTLRYAKRAKDITNKPKINEDLKDTIIKRYHDEIQQLKRIIAQEIPVPRQLLSEIQEIKNESVDTILSFHQARTRRCEKTEKMQTNQSERTGVIAEYQTRLVETQKLHIRACQESTTLKRELDELKTQLQIQQRKLDYEARKSILEEHKTALMMLRSRRTAEGANILHTGNELREINDTASCRREQEDRHASPVEMSSVVTLPRMLTPEPSKESAFGREEVVTEIPTGVDMTPLPELTLEPDIPCMVSVGTSTDDLFELKIDVQLPNEYEGDIEGWHIRENMLCRGDAEGRSRSVSPYTAEKNYAGKQECKGKSGFLLDEEGPADFGLCCLCPERSFFGERLDGFFKR